MGGNKIACKISYTKQCSLSFHASLKKNATSVLVMFFIVFFINLNKAKENSNDVVRKISKPSSQIGFKSD